MERNEQAGYPAAMHLIFARADALVGRSDSGAPTFGLIHLQQQKSTWEGLGTFSSKPQPPKI